MGLVVHAVQALDHRLLHLVDPLGGGAGFGVDPPDRVVMDLDLEVLGPAAVAAKPRRAVSVQLAHAPIVAEGAAGSGESAADLGNRALEGPNR